MVTLANSEDSHEMLHDTAFHWDLHGLEGVGGGEIITCDLSISTMDPIIPYLPIFVCLFVCFVALRPKSTAMVMAGQSFHLTTLFSWASLKKQLTSTSCTYFRL